ncbi:MAG TPA: uroporphyrinogen-III C-methyltransferase [Gammaproteobacteria bacterium]|nr:uroporphyrinogen-III C-methyltransferase [Gammaproteobacteria bacterium]
MSKPETPSNAAAAKPPAPKTPKPPRKRTPLGALVIGLALIVALAALAGSAYTWWRTRDVIARADQVPALKQTIARQQAALSGLRQQLDQVAGQATAAARLESRIATLNRETKSALANLSTRIDAVASDTRDSLARLQQAVSAPRAGAHIADAAYLLRVARHQAQIRHDAAGMRAALAGAQQALAGLNAPAAQTLRRQVDAALAALGDQPAHTADAVAQKLAGLASQVSALPLPTPTVKAENEPAAPPAAPQHWWQRIGAGLASAFSELVTVRHVGHDVQPLLAPEQRWFLYRNLSLELDAARIAALKGDAAAYRASVERARAWLGQYFDTGSADVKAMLAALAELGDVRLQPALPDLSPAFDALEHLRRQAGAAATGAAS